MKKGFLLRGPQREVAKGGARKKVNILPGEHDGLYKKGVRTARAGGAADESGTVRRRPLDERRSRLSRAVFLIERNVWKEKCRDCIGLLASHGSHKATSRRWWAWATDGLKVDHHRRLMDAAMWITICWREYLLGRTLTEWWDNCE